MCRLLFFAILTRCPRFITATVRFRDRHEHFSLYAKTKILLNLEEEEARRVQSILHLSEAEVMEITHFERGNGLISTNNNNVTVEIKCSQMEKDLITTDRRELQELLSQSDGVDIA